MLKDQDQVEWTLHVLCVRIKAFRNFVDVTQHPINRDTELEVGDCSEVQTQLRTQLWV